jgi:hypothetical protein
VCRGIGVGVLVCKGNYLIKKPEAVTSSAPAKIQSKMGANVTTKTEIKSAEQRLMERATEEYISKLRAFLGAQTSATIIIEGVPVYKLGVIAEFLKDEEGRPVKIRLAKSLISGERNFILHTIKGDGYQIEQISE